MQEYYARSGNEKRNIPAQTYYDHISGSLELCERYLDSMIRYSRHEEIFNRNFKENVLLAMKFHDLGKLDSENQKILNDTKTTASLVYRHEDAGSAFLLKHYPAAIFPISLIYSHHQGFQNMMEEEARGKCEFRRYHKTDREKEHIDDQLETYIQIHRELFPNDTEFPERFDKYNGLDLRLGLSCLSDADHRDAAQWGRNPPKPKMIQRRWQDRLDALDRHIARLNNDLPRNRDRNDVYRICRESSLSEGDMETCSSPVGTGKTTAIMARLLRFAIKYDLRHIFVVVPYTNIIQQTVDIYRNILALPGENPEEIIGEHHHLAEFSDPEFASYSTRWESPIIVTTAVQFFETLGSNNPTRLCKFHELPGSAIFIDEAHAVMPLHLWPQEWKWLNILVRKWCCPLILGSGSLRKFWENARFFGKSNYLPDILPNELKNKLQDTENARIRFYRERKAWGSCDLKKHILSDIGGSKLLVLNTVYSAASVARILREAGAEVLHLSTALAPRDRASLLQKIKRRLNSNDPEYINDWILVATSCVETGINFSFTKGYRECCSVANLFQISGRINRDMELSGSGIVTSFRLFPDENLSLHPGFLQTQDIQDQLFTEGLFDGTHSMETIFEKELCQIVEYDKQLGRKDELIKAENCKNLKRVSELCRVIEEHDSRLVIIDQELAKRLKDHGKVNSLEIQRNSIQIPKEYAELLEVEKIFPDDNLYCWTLPYDPDFFGYMTEETQKSIREMK